MHQRDRILSTRFGIMPVVNLVSDRVRASALGGALMHHVPDHLVFGQASVTLLSMICR